MTDLSSHSRFGVRLAKYGPLTMLVDCLIKLYRVNVVEYAAREDEILTGVDDKPGELLSTVEASVENLRGKVDTCAA